MDTAALTQSMQTSLGQHVPHLLGALVMLLVGWFIAVALRAAVRRGLGLVGLNRHFTGMTGQTLDLEAVLAVAVFWVVLLLTLAGVFNTLDLGMLSNPFAALTTQLFEYAPRLLAGLLLALLAWLAASIARAAVNKALQATTLDEKLSEHAGMAPISQGLGQIVFWLVVLLFLPAILNALQMQGLLEPLRAMLTKTLDMLPNAFAALIIAGVGWIVAHVLRSLVTGLSRGAGVDQLGGRAGLAPTVQLSGVLGALVFIVVLVPSLIAALDALKIEAISRPAIDMLNVMMLSVPRIIAAGLILVITWVVASFASRLLAGLLAAAGFDTLPARVSLAHAFEKTSASVLVGRVALFFAMLFATVEAADQLGFHRVSDVVTTFIRFGGDVLLGSAILVIGFLLANVAYEAIDRASGAHTEGLARIGRYAILALVIAMGLRAMGIADDIVNLAFGLTLGAVAVAVALSFGLGGREAAGKLMEHWLSKLRGGDQ
ncbi:MAG: mechanosensitive ion channel [Ramlibacter sp.]|nr:mechanosensitive ion channel [Ramlibacter sp.]